MDYELICALAQARPAILAGFACAGLATCAYAASTWRRWRVSRERSNPWARAAARSASRLAMRLHSRMDGTGLRLTPNELASVWLACAVVPPLVAVAIGLAWPLALALLAAGAAAPELWAMAARGRSRRRFEETLGQALPLVASNLRGGLTFRTALVPVGENMDEPLRGEFERLGADIDQGVPIEEALGRMAERNDSKDVALLASAVMAQRETGGNLAEVVDSVAVAVRVRCELRQMVRSKTSQARASATILAMLPPVLLAATCAINPAALGFYTSPAGLATIAAIAVLIVSGYLIMRRMSALEAD